MGSPWSSEKPAKMDLHVTHKELEELKKDITPVGQIQQQGGGGRGETAFLSTPFGACGGWRRLTTLPML